MLSSWFLLRESQKISIRKKGLEMSSKNNRLDRKTLDRIYATQLFTEPKEGQNPFFDFLGVKPVQRPVKVQETEAKADPPAQQETPGDD